MKLVKASILLITTTLLLTTGSLTAECYNTCVPCDRWLVYVDALYWKVRNCYLKSLLLPEKERIPILTPDYDWGVRVGIYKECKDWSFGARYTHYNMDKKAENPFVTDGQLTDIFQQKYDLDLNVLNLETRRRCGSPNKSIDVFGGVELAFIDQKGVVVEQINNELVSNQKIDMNAYGLYAGGEGSWTFCKGLGVFGRASIGVLSGGFTQRGLIPPDEIHFLINCLIKHFEYSAGIDYHLTCKSLCCELAFQLGYEFHSWDNMVPFFTTLPFSDTLDIEGLFARLKVTF